MKSRAFETGVKNTNLLVADRIRIKFYGTRGSIPICDSNFFEFGGNTTCLSIFNEDNRRLSVIDAGTGIRKLGQEIMGGIYEQSNSTINLGFSHFHWDHIQGFPFFEPAYDQNTELNIIALGRDRPMKSLRELFEIQMQLQFFPVQIDNLGARIKFIWHEGENLELGLAKITAQKHSHPGTCYSFRMQWKNKSIVICTDIEHPNGLDENIIELARGADILIHDAQYTSKELLNKKGWGHSSYEQAIEVAEKAEVRRLIMTHHDPDHDDAFLNKMEKHCQERYKTCELAREGREYIV